MSEEATPSHSYTDRSQNYQESGKITPELVRKVTDRVYAMLVADLKIERERRFPRVERTGYKRGRLKC
jgi:hypothetical protein